MAGPDAGGLSARETEILAAVAAHETNAQIAADLHLSVRTVESHVSSLLRKLDAADRRELAARAPSIVPSGAPAADGIAGLPVTWTSFVGRDDDLDRAVGLLSSNRLVTLLGPGGMGKTRLAIAVGAAAQSGFPGGGAFVDLVPASGEYVVHAVAAALGVTERPNTDLEDMVHERLRNGRSLLILDNCEHVLVATAAFVDRALRRSPGLVVLATSRERLSVDGEVALPVPPLAVDGPGGTAEPAAATRLFVDRALAQDRDFRADDALVAELCRRLGGMPLAIELAAARVASLGVDGLLAGLDDRLRLLTRSGGGDPRHRSLRSVIDWSHDLLDDEEQVAFRRLSVFHGGFDLEAAAQVLPVDDRAATADVVGRLVDKNLLVHRRGAGGSRWRMLEAVRAYAGEQLAGSGDADDVLSRYRSWAMNAATDLERRIDDDDPAWLEEFDAIADDLRAAAAAAPSGHDDEAFRSAMLLGHLTYARGFQREAQSHYESASDRTHDAGRKADALHEAAHVAFANVRADIAYELLLRVGAQAAEHGDHAHAAIAASDAVTLARRFPAEFAAPIDRAELAGVLASHTDLMAGRDPLVDAHFALAAAWNGTDRPTVPDHALAWEALEQARRLDDPRLLAAALDAVGALAQGERRFQESARLAAERLALLDRLPRHLPSSGGEVSDILHMASDSALLAGRLDVAVAHALLVHDELGTHVNPHMAASHLVTPFVLQGRFDDALAQAAVMRRSWEDAGRPPAAWIAPAILATALVHALQGDDEAARDWHGLVASLAHGPTQGFRMFADARVALHRGDLTTGRALLDEPAFSSNYELYAGAVLAELSVVAGSEDANERVAAAMTAGKENDWAAACAVRAVARQRNDTRLLGDAIDAWTEVGAAFERACTMCLLPDRADEGRAALRALGCQPPAV